MGAHARLGPSNHRWPHCAGSVREEARYEDIPGDAAIDGTGSHLLLEMCLENNVRAEAYEGQIIGVNDPENPNGWLISDDRIKRVQMCLDYISRRVKELQEQFPGATVTVEAESHSDPGGMFGRSDWWGTVDITITAYDSHTGTVYFIEVCDYKDGRGFVDTKDDVYGVNTQLLSYLLGKLRKHIASGPDLVRPLRYTNVKNAQVSIVQPKTNPVVRRLPINPVTLGPSVDALSRAAHATDDPNAPLTPGKHCQWCKANPKRGGHCTAETDQTIETVMNMNTEVIASDAAELPAFESLRQAVADPKTLTENQLADLADARAAMNAAFDKVDAEIEHRIETGLQVPGYAMRPGRATRVWNDDEEVIAKALKGRRLKKDDIYPTKLISPAQLEKLGSLTPEQKDKLLKKYVTEKAGKLKLTKVARNEPSQEVIKDVEQCSTNSVDSGETMLFGSLAPTAETPKSLFPEPEADVPASTDEVSFF